MNNFFNNSAFNGIDSNIKKELEAFLVNIKNKSPNEVSIEAIALYNKLQNNKNFTIKERELLIELILSSLGDSDKKKFFKVFNTVTNMKR